MAYGKCLFLIPEILHFWHLSVPHCTGTKAVKQMKISKLQEIYISYDLIKVILVPSAVCQALGDFPVYQMRI